MTPTLIYRRSILRDLLNSLAYHKRRIIAVGLVGLAVTIGIAILVQPPYRADSSLLVLLGTEYTYRGVAGQEASNNGALTNQQILKTEADILGSDGLRRQVIQQIGLDRLYPDLLKPPTGIPAVVAKIRSWVEGLVNPGGSAKGGRKLDTLTEASMKFGGNLSVMVDRDASVIQLGFEHPSPQLAAEALRQLETDYLNRRRQLFGDVQAPLLESQAQHMRQQLQASDDALEAFKRSHQIGDFAARRTIMLQQQGALETSLRTVQGRIVEETARLNVLQQQTHVTAGEAGKGRVNPAAPLEGMVQAFRSQERTVQQRYFGSAAADRARTEAMLRQTEIAKLRSESAFALQKDADKTAADLRGDLAGRDALMAQLQSVDNEVSAINQDELRLRELETARAVADTNYRNAAKVLGVRELVENVEAGKEQGVRVIQPPLVPALPVPLRRMILAAGLLITAILMAMMALIAHFFRTIYFSSDDLETSTELTVLASVPETRTLEPLLIAVRPS
jgi:uncharacterized protein involved in exopolysaccharide biosynthesis